MSPIDLRAAQAGPERPASARIRRQIGLLMLHVDGAGLLEGASDWIDGAFVPQLKGSIGQPLESLFDASDWAAIRTMACGQTPVVLPVATSIGDTQLEISQVAVGEGFILMVREGRAAAPKRRIRAVEDRLRAILDHAADAIIVIDTKGGIENANLAVERLTGWRLDELKGQSISLLMGPVHAMAHQKQVDRYLETGRSGILNSGSRSLPLRAKDGRYVPIELSVGEAVIAGERKFIGVCRDISERIEIDSALRAANERLHSQVDQLRALSDDLAARQARMEALAAEADAARLQAEHANEAKSRFIATMSHELRTPLNGVLAIADALGGRPLTKRDHELVGLIRSSGESLLSILNEMLDLARIEAGVVALEPAPFDLGALLHEVAEVWRVAAEAKGLALEVLVDPRVGWVLGDAKRIRQVLSNLINNAIKFTDHGSVRLSAEAQSEDGELRLEVLDSGPGMPFEQRDRMFEPFAQGDASITRRHGGAGLGLAICRELIELMGGGIEALPGPNGGTTMVVTAHLPPALAHEASEVEHAANDHIAFDPLILVAEDHPLNRRVIAIVLEQAGLRFRFAEDGLAAVEAVASGAFDIVLMDVHMPRLDGLEATRRIRASSDPKRAGIPIVAVTANVSAAEAEACEAAGMDAVVGKPISAGDLLATIAKLLVGAGPIAANRPSAPAIP